LFRRLFVCYHFYASFDNLLCARRCIFRLLSAEGRRNTPPQRQTSEAIMESWTRPLGSSRDYAELVAVVLSIARIKHAVERVSLRRFFAAMRHASLKHPLLDGFEFRLAGQYVLSPCLAGALQDSMQFGVDMNGSAFQDVAVDPRSAERIIDWSKRRSGEDYVSALTSVAATFAEYLKAA
jgi:hypothetical protein